MQNITLITAIAGLAFGLVGAVLGILNTWRAFDRDRIRVRVVPVALIYENGADGFGIEVTNLSYFPVTVSGLGFTVRGHDERLTFLPSDIRGCQLPQRMEPRTSFTAILPVRTGDHPKWSFVHRAYADTACGRRFTGTSGALRQKLKHGGAARK
jgi:hypothetical protein